MRRNFFQSLGFGVYELAWRLAVPFLRRNPRLAEGFEQRILQTELPRADIWIQAASGGEAYLARELLRQLITERHLAILLTTNTRQGMDILEQAVRNLGPEQRMRVHLSYFPFDRPGLMRKAVRQVRPQAAVFLETELWPGLLAALKTYGSRILVINGRIRPRSLQHYRIWPSLWRHLRPDRVLAISPEDARRFGVLFGAEQTGEMSNIKFDRMLSSPPGEIPSLQSIMPPEHSFLVLGSVRQEEEPEIEKIIRHIRHHCPDTVIGLFPRHLHRLDAWQERLRRSGMAYSLRSRTDAPVSGGTILLWDTFGELAPAYQRADAAFIGGSLAPLGGQNFMEPLMYGVVPVIGPSWYNFSWVGRDIIDQGLLRVGEEWRRVAEMLTDSLKNPQNRDEVCDAFRDFLRNRQGGTVQACQCILAYLRYCEINL